MSATYDRIASQVLGSRTDCLTRMRDAEWRNVQGAARALYAMAALFINAALDIIGDK